MSVVVIVADGARLDAFTGSLDAYPALARMREEGGVHPVTTVFPSVTGPAYIPFLLGRFPGPVGIPALRWFDRSRTTCAWPDYARSYVGYQYPKFDEDLDPSAPTIFELVPNSIAAMSVVTRGLAVSRRIGGLTPKSALRAVMTHFRGKVSSWLDVDRDVANEIVRRVRDERPDFAFAALTGVDKASHAEGYTGELVHEAMRIVDDTVARLREDAERGGYWNDMHLWVVSDHGHSDVRVHEDLAGIVALAGLRTVAHPWSAGLGADSAVMVSGNAMAHIYLELQSRERPWWTGLDARWGGLAEQLLARPSVDLMLLPRSRDLCEVRSASRGNAMVSRSGSEFSYQRVLGDPLGLGRDVAGDMNQVHDALRDSSYPDALVQILALAGSPRSGDLILSAEPGWDFRAKYEPIPHRSAHGALHRDHMLVPLLVNRQLVRSPRRTTDVFASAVSALGVESVVPGDGESFVG